MRYLFENTRIPRPPNQAFLQSIARLKITGWLIDRDGQTLEHTRVLTPLLRDPKRRTVARWIVGFGHFLKENGVLNLVL